MLNSLILFSVLLADSTFFHKDKFLIRPAFKSLDYKYWSKLDAKSYCANEPESTSKFLAKVTEIAATKTNVLYLTNTDILACKDSLPGFADIAQSFGILLAMNLLESGIDSNAYFDESGTLKLSYFTDKFKDQGSISEWVSYFVFDNAMEKLTFSERQLIRVELRNIFRKSFIGFRFDPKFGPTPENTNPNRKEKQWDEFLPKDDDGDFIITTLPVKDFKRTLVFAEDRKVITELSSGEFL